MDANAVSQSAAALPAAHAGAGVSLRSGQSPARRLAWLAGRLRNMSLPEIAHRVEEQAKRLVSRHRVPAFDAYVTVGDQPLPQLPGLADAVRTLAGQQAVAAVWARDFARVRRNAFELLGRHWPQSDGAPDWHRDPVTGGHWPADSYCYDIPYRHADALGDVKFTWELGRLRYLQTVAAHAHVTGDADASALCVDHIVSWLSDNPPFRGVGWATGIEVALRVISIIVVASLLPQDAWTEPQRKLLRRGLAAHGYWLARFPSRFSSANNHLIAEVCGLYLLGVLAPDLKPAGRWARTARRVLEQEVTRQFLPDGVGAEQSPTYAAFSAEFFLLSGHVGGLVGQPFPDAYWESLARHAVSIKGLMDAGGHVPAIGDDDEGRVISAGMRDENYVASVLGCLAHVLNCPDLAPPQVEPSFRNAVFGLPAAGPESPQGVTSFVDGGYTVARDRIDGREAMWVLDHGPLGYLSIAAHGHADALAVWLHLEGRPVIVDAGTFQYHADGGWRNHFRSTPAHSTLSVAGEDQSVISGTFNWSHKARATLVDFQREPDWSIEAEHDGYVARHGVVHRRRLARLAVGQYRITDTLIGAAGRALPVEIGFLFAPDLSVTAQGDAWLIARDGTPLLRLRHEGQLRGQVLRGQESPPRGWYSPSFGRREPTSLLSFAGALPAGDGIHFSITILAGTGS